VASSGLHSNGYSLVRRNVEMTGLSVSSPAPFADGASLGEALLTPTRLYVKSALAAIGRGGVKGLAHITGGGIPGNLPRALPVGLDAELDLSAWELPPVFGWLSREAALAQSEMLRTFNCGVGLIAVVDKTSVPSVIAALNQAGERAFQIGELVPSEGPEPQTRYRGNLG
jgi:phosphoribosylformylglycinamidine cyclo-ligase